MDSLYEFTTNNYKGKQNFVGLELNVGLESVGSDFNNLLSSSFKGKMNAITSSISNAMEYLSGAIRGVTNPNTFSNLIQRGVDNLTGKSESTIYILTSKASEMRNISRSASSKYGTISDMRVMVPVGLKVPMNKAAAEISEVVNDIVLRTINHVEAAEMLATKMLCDEDFRNSISPIASDSKHIDELANTIFKKVEMCIGNAPRDSEKYTKAYGNINSLIQTYNSLTEIKNPPSLRFLADLSKEVTDLTNRSNELIGFLDSMRVEYNKKHMKEFAMRLDSVANLVTQSIAAIILFHKLCEATENTIVRINEIL